MHLLQLDSCTSEGLEQLYLTMCLLGRMGENLQLESKTLTNREVQGSLSNIFQTLKWMGIDSDQYIQKEGPYGPYIQSQRLSIYKNIEKHMLKNNYAYPCFCPEHTTQAQKAQKNLYDKTCRKLTFNQIKDRIKNQEPYAVRLKSDLIKMPVTFHDEVYGDLQFKQLDDFVIVRKNGWPTFHLANVVDDLQMGITHVMRGEEWLCNTNKHIYLYHLLGSTPPKFVHLPLIKAMNGKKLAKRDPTSSVQFIKNSNYQIQAVKSFLFQMGLNRKDCSQNIQQTLQGQQEGVKAVQNNSKQKKQLSLRLLTEDQMINEFDLSRITRVPVKFDIKQLDFLNKLAIKKRWKEADKNQEHMAYFIDKVYTYIPASRNYQIQYILKVISSIIDRLSIITEISLYAYYFQEPNYLDQKGCEDFHKIFGKNSRLVISYNQKGQKSYDCLNHDLHLKDKNKKVIHNIRMIFQHIIAPQQYNEVEIAKRISEFLFQSPELKNEDVYHLLRYMVTARKSGPNITLACAIIGRQKILARMQPFSNL